MNSSILFDLLPLSFEGKNGPENVQGEEGKVYGLYFSAHWCPPCKAFTPKLKSFYEAANKSKKQIEIIFVSSDKDKESFNTYFSSMPWVSLPFEKKDIKEVLGEVYGIEGIPTLLIFDNKGKLVDGKARMTVTNRYPKDGYDEQRAQTVINIWNGIQP